MKSPKTLENSKRLQLLEEIVWNDFRNYDKKRKRDISGTIGWIT